MPVDVLLSAVPHRVYDGGAHVHVLASPCDPPIALTHDEFALLGVCAPVGTAEQHLAHAVSSHGVAPEAVAATFDRLCRLGLIRTLGNERRRSSPDAVPYRCVCVVSGDRPTLLQQVLASIERASAAAEQVTNIAVIDRSKSRSSEAASRQVVRAAMRDCVHARLTFVGTDERRRISSQLVKRFEINPELAAFAFDEGVGAGRNLAAVLMGRRPFVFVDDDIDLQALAYRSPSTARTLLVEGHSDSRRHLFCHNRHDVLAAVEPVTVDVVGELLSCVGAPFDTLLSDFGREADWTRACPELAHAAREPEGWRVRLAAAGSAGDPGTGGPDHLLFCNEPLRTALRSNTELLQAALMSRESVHIPAAYTVTHRAWCMLYCAAIDGRDDIPPFMPKGRNADGVFGRMLSLTDSQSLSVLLPVGVMHSSPRASAYTQEIGAVARMTVMSDVFLWALQSVAFRGADALRAEFRTLGRLAPKEFSWSLNDGLRNRRSVELETLRNTAADRSVPDVLRERCIDYVNQLSEALKSAHFAVPVECRADTPDEGFRVTQHVLGEFAKLLDIWGDARDGVLAECVGFGRDAGSPVV